MKFLTLFILTGINVFAQSDAERCEELVKQQVTETSNKDFGYVRDSEQWTAQITSSGCEGKVLERQGTIVSMHGKRFEDGLSLQSGRQFIVDLKTEEVSELNGWSSQVGKPNPKASDNLENLIASMLKKEHKYKSNCNRFGLCTFELDRQKIEILDNGEEIKILSDTGDNTELHQLFNDENLKREEQRRLQRISLLRNKLSKLDFQLPRCKKNCHEWESLLRVLPLGIDTRYSESQTEYQNLLTKTQNEFDDLSEEEISKAIINLNDKLEIIVNLEEQIEKHGVSIGFF